MTTRPDDLPERLDVIGADIGQMNTTERFATAVLLEAIRDGDMDLFDETLPIDGRAAAVATRLRDVIDPLSGPLREGAVMTLEVLIDMLRHVGDA